MNTRSKRILPVIILISTANVAQAAQTKQEFSARQQAHQQLAALQARANNLGVSLDQYKQQLENKQQLASLAQAQAASYRLGSTMSDYVDIDQVRVQIRQSIKESMSEAESTVLFNKIDACYPVDEATNAKVFASFSEKELQVYERCSEAVMTGVAIMQLKAKKLPLVQHRDNLEKLKEIGHRMESSMSEAECKLLIDKIEGCDLDDPTQVAKAIKKMSSTEAALLQRTASSAYEKHGINELFLAIEKNDVSMVKSLLMFPGLHEKAVNLQGQTPILFAAAGGNLELVQHCVQKCGADLGRKDRDGDTLLMTIAIAGNNDVFDYYMGLVQQPTSKIQIATQINQKNKYGFTALMLAIEDGSSAHMVEHLLKLGADIDLADKHGMTAVDRVCKAGPDIQDTWSSCLDARLQAEKQRKQQELEDQKKRELAFEQLLLDEAPIKGKSPKSSPTAKTKEQKLKEKLAKEKAQEAEQKAAKEHALHQAREKAAAIKLEQTKLASQEREAALELRRQELAEVEKEKDNLEVAGCHDLLRSQKTAFKQWHHNAQANKHLRLQAQEAQRLEQARLAAELLVQKEAETKQRMHEQEQMRVQQAAEQVRKEQEFRAQQAQQKALETVYGQQPTGQELCFQAIADGDFPLVRMFLNNSMATVRSCDKAGNTALMVAIKKGDLDFIEYLLSRGAQVQVKNISGHTPAWLAAASNDSAAMLKLLSSYDSSIDIVGAMGAYQQQRLAIIARKHAELEEKQREIDQLRYENKALASPTR